MKKIYFLLITILLCTSCNKIIIDKLPRDYYINIKNKEIEVYNDIKLDEIIETNVKINKQELLNTDKVGNITKLLNFKIKKKIYQYHINYNVVDKTPPKIYGGSDKTVNVNYEGNLCNLVMYGDNYDKSPKCNIIGDYNLNEIGTYKIELEVIDSSNNKSNHNINLNVIKPIESNNKEIQEKTKTLFNDIYNDHKSDKTMIGIDISRWQGDIDYNKIKSSGVEFVIMRIGVQQKLNEDISMDSKYLQNIKYAHESGLKVGVYLYSMSMSKEESIKQARWVINNLNSEPLDLGIVFDWENWANWNNYKLSFHNINDIMYSFVNEVKKVGYEGVLYSSKFYLENIWNNKYNYPVWLAHYTDKTNYEGKYELWQLCNNGRIDGINGDVDIDILYLN